jgi:hypothetical protein
MTSYCMSNVCRICGILLAMVAPIAWGQCATGVNTGGGNCVPPDASGMPGYNGDYNRPMPAQPAPIWADSWGAIAIDDQNGDAGTIANRDSKAAAEAAAMRDCAVRGATGCKIALTYHNQCAAIAWGDSARAAAGNPNEQGAKDDAMRLCQKSTSGCKVVYSACSTARRIN